MTYAIVSDRRKIVAEPDLAAHERAVEAARALIELQVRLSRELRRIDETKTFVVLGCASMGEYAVRLGLTSRDVHRLIALGHALDAAPLAAWTSEESGPVSVAEAVLAGAISVEKAALAGRLLATPGLVREGENAVQLAATMPTRRMVSLVRLREEELAQQQPVTPLALAVSPGAKEHFGRARVVASEEAGTMLTEGEAFAVVVEHYLDTFDPLRRGEGARRLPDTAELPAQRYIPAEVRRSVRERSGDRCEVPGCVRDAFLEFAHLHAHADGGSREKHNLVRLCRVHHVLLDARRILFNGWTDDRPTFRHSNGELIEEAPAFVRTRTDRVDEFSRRGPETTHVSERPPPERGAGSEAGERQRQLVAAS